MKSIGSRLKLERTRLRLTQEKAGDISGVCRRAWNKYEKDICSPTAITLAAFCKAGADPEFILIGPKSTPEAIKQALICTGFIKPANLVNED